MRFIRVEGKNIKKAGHFVNWLFNFGILLSKVCDELSVIDVFYYFNLIKTNLNLLKKHNLFIAVSDLSDSRSF